MSRQKISCLEGSIFEFLNIFDLIKKSNIKLWVCKKKKKVFVKIDCCNSESNTISKTLNNIILLTFVFFRLQL